MCRLDVAFLVSCVCVFFCNVESGSSQGQEGERARDKEMKGCVGGVKLRKERGTKDSRRGMSGRRDERRKGEKTAG